MISNDVAVSARDLRKVYRLYTHPRYRVLDMLGLLRGAAGRHYTEHVALDGINFEVRRGEKVGIIGRNGAGKSTLLKLITQVIRPTSGTIELKSDTQALLQIGSGFHPEFSGRENVRAYLAHLGITGNAAERAITEVIDFAELEEYIDQPVKTYSTGMGMRLMFSAATVMTPSLLVIDEILGVGDAYFANKSFERIRSMCAGQHTTLLLVTHDIFGAAKLCDRMVWIEHGRIVCDGSVTTVLRAYDNSIREQEESRLRKKKIAGMPKVGAGAASSNLIVEIHAADNKPLPDSVYINRISLTIGGTPIASAPLVDNSFDSARSEHLVAEGSCWGETVLWQGRQARIMRHFGSSFHKVAAIFSVAPNEMKESLGVRLVYSAGVECNLRLTAFLNEAPVVTDVSMPVSVNEWRELDVAFSAVQPETHHVPFSSTVNASKSGLSPSSGESSMGEDATLSAGTPLSAGTGRVWISNIVLRDGAGRPVHVFEHGDPCRIEIFFDICDPDFDEPIDILATLHRDGVNEVARMLGCGLHLSRKQESKGIFVLDLPNLSFGEGRYTLSVSIVKKDYFFSIGTQKFYTINEDLYCQLSRAIELVVLGNTTFVRAPALAVIADWRVVREKGL